MIVGASESIDVLGPNGFLRLGIPIEDAMLTADSRLRLQTILTKPLAGGGNAEYAWERNPSAPLFTATMLAPAGWKVRTSKAESPISAVIVDERELALVQMIIGKQSVIPNFVIEGRVNVLPYQIHFNRLWSSLNRSETRDGESTETLWDDVLGPAIPQIETHLVQVSNSYWDELIVYLARNPEKLHGISPRRFEELIAEILSREGLQTHLTPERKDGGCDVLAVADTAAGKHLYLVECKRYRTENPVGVELVRALYGTVQQRNATAGLLVTTSSFTRGALDFQKPIEYRIALKGYKELAVWLNRIAPKELR